MKVGVVGLGTMGAVSRRSRDAGLERSAARCRGARERARDDRALPDARSRKAGSPPSARRSARAAQLTTELAELAGCDLVIEAILEELEPKRELFAELDRDHAARRGPRHEHVRALGLRDRGGERAARARRRHALLQPGAADAARRDRPRASSTTTKPSRRRTRGRSSWQAAGPLQRHARLHRQPVLIPLLNDCVRVLDEAHVTPEDLDTAMKNGAGWPLGPCALVDLVGIDVHVHASEALHAQLGEPRMAPPERLVEMQREGKLGRKSRPGLLLVRDRRAVARARRLRIGTRREPTPRAGCSCPARRRRARRRRRRSRRAAAHCPRRRGSRTRRGRSGTAPFRPPHMTNRRSPTRRRVGSRSSADDERAARRARARSRARRRRARRRPSRSTSRS